MEPPEKSSIRKIQKIHKSGILKDLSEVVPDTAPPDQPDPKIPSTERRMAETPVPNTLNRKRHVPGHTANHLRKSKYAGLLFYLLLSNEIWIQESLSNDHRLWIKDFLGNIPEDIILKSYSFALKIYRNKRIRNSLTEEIVKELRSYRSPKVNRSPEPRRIGVGYRDKGALRPLHLRRNVGEDCFWWDDIRHLLPGSSNPTGKDFITTEEVLSQGINPDHLLLVLQQLSVMASFETLSFS